ncbi:MAG: AbrB/MazE/SpoVT family DNA-binding domain-containing protein [Verrucomicrobia bacterium]|nr:AbrB/MazE/SpoVT family DNA-binding domain-containing protein [Verrucomicrobiota bacterium]MBS0636318.1 AbrB/MazE/SpoVT family DNA-binding domain-containing protein [Verrucomicrobiota bacterium]
MQSHVQRWGNSLGVRIPIQFAKELNLHAGSAVTLEIEDGRLVLQPPKYDLGVMLDAINSKNQHHLLLDDKKSGNEEW